MNKPSNTSPPPIAVILAAGKGTRMRSRDPKVLHRAAGRPLLDWVVRAAVEAGCRKILLVVGHRAQEVRSGVEALGLDVEIDWVEQKEQKGTGHALAQALSHVEAPARLLVLSGDVPLVRGETLRQLLAAAESGWALATAELDEPGSLGRVVAGSDGSLDRIVEAADASAEELEIGSVNAGLYVVPSSEIGSHLERLQPANAQGELYLTDAVTAAVADGTVVDLFELPDAHEALGVNDRADLARVHRKLLDRTCARHMVAGVTVLEPERTVIEAEVSIGPDSVVHPGVSLLGRTVIGTGSTVHSNSWIRDSVLGDGVEIGPSTVLEEAEVGDRCRVGPFARLRPGTRLGEGSRIGNFVEIKNSRLGAGVKAGHLAYLGDAEIGDRANIGAGTVTCNYDGSSKNKTEIGADAFVGSDTMLVAPVRLGKRSTTAAGSVITTDIPDGALGVGRARQRNLPGWADRKDRGKRKD